MTTLLSLSTIAFPINSERGMTQTLEPIEQAKQVGRTINGGLKNKAQTQFQKYRSTISCSDMNSPAFDKKWPGLTVVVDCIHELSYVTAGGSPGRTVVGGSSRTQGAHTFYRPQLTMLVVSMNVQNDEYGAAVSWTLDLEEV